MSDILRAIDLTKRFRGTPVLDHLNLDVPEGSIYAMVGINGAGKCGFRGKANRIPG